MLSALEEVAGNIEQKNKELEEKGLEFEREAALHREKQVNMSTPSHIPYTLCHHPFQGEIL